MNTRGDRWLLVLVLVGAPIEQYWNCTHPRVLQRSVVGFIVHTHEPVEEITYRGAGDLSQTCSGNRPNKCSASDEHGHTGELMIRLAETEDRSLCHGVREGLLFENSAGPMNMILTELDHVKDDHWMRPGSDITCRFSVTVR